MLGTASIGMDSNAPMMPLSADIVFVIVSNDLVVGCFERSLGSVVSLVTLERALWVACGPWR